MRPLAFALELSFERDRRCAAIRREPFLCRQARCGSGCRAGTGDDYHDEADCRLPAGDIERRGAPLCRKGTSLRAIIARADTTTPRGRILQLCDVGHQRRHINKASRRVSPMTNYRQWLSRAMYDAGCAIHWHDGRFRLLAPIDAAQQASDCSADDWCCRPRCESRFDINLVWLRLKCTMNAISIR